MVLNWVNWTMETLSAGAMSYLHGAGEEWQTKEGKEHRVAFDDDLHQRGNHQADGKRGLSRCLTTETSEK